MNIKISSLLLLEFKTLATLWRYIRVARNNNGRENNNTTFIYRLEKDHIAPNIVTPILISRHAHLFLCQKDSCIFKVDYLNSSPLNFFIVIYFI